MKIFLSLPLVAGLLLASHAVSAQTEQPASTTQAEAPSTAIGPRYKNPLAAGRAGYKSPATASTSEMTLVGPAYKNRKRTPTAAADPTSRQPQLTGPRYKNRKLGRPN
ncbi:hypothetical protein QWY85_13710 [Neolewinella lacunae]|uniref:Uncharacterized protein n=1 Tax=Neolewinella lacunae TaxID=1517758 RepID=A0A923PFL6_9BACT|nr:hypothetical protein [Neolewinella lacunae]MBC6993233.1 hypothetical protein [Neolewinella lacunae]MDN3635720.1 hypothetical protein [Neolewinella lacunae]